VPLLVTVLAGNVVTAAVVAACLNTVDATVLRRLNPAIAVAIAAVPWADTTTAVRDITRWRAALPAAVGCGLVRRKLPVKVEVFDNANIARLPPTLRSLDASHCWQLKPNVSFEHLWALERLDCTNTSAVVAGVARLPPSLRELRINDCELHATADFSHLRTLRLLEHTCDTLSAATIASLPPSLEVLNIDGGYFRNNWPPGGSFAHLTRLRVLGLARTCVDAAALATFPPSLHSLDLGHCELIAAASFAHLHCLRTLDASHSNIDDAALATLPPSLVSLDLSCWWRKVRSLTKAAVFPHLPALRVLKVSRATLGDAAVASMPPGLVELHMVGCPNVTRSTSLDHLTALRVLHSAGTRVSSATIASCRARGCTALADGVVANAANADDVCIHLVPLPNGQLVGSPSSRVVSLWAAIDCAAPLAQVQIEDALGCATALAVLPDGHRVAIAVRYATVPGGIFVWDTRATTREPVPVPVMATHATINFVYKATAILLAVLRGGHLAIGYIDGTLRIVDIDASAVLTTLEGHGKLTALAALLDGKAACAYSDHTVRLWDVEAGVCTATLAGHTHHIHSLAVLPDGHLASASLDKTVRLWDVSSHTCVRVLPGDTRALVVLPGSNRLGSQLYDRLVVWDTRDATEVPLLTVELVGSGTSVLVLLPDGRLATGGYGVHLWQLPPEVQAPL